MSQGCFGQLEAFALYLGVEEKDRPLVSTAVTAKSGGRCGVAAAPE